MNEADINSVCNCDFLWEMHMNILFLLFGLGSCDPKSSKRNMNEVQVEIYDIIRMYLINIHGCVHGCVH